MPYAIFTEGRRRRRRRRAPRRLAVALALAVLLFGAGYGLRELDSRSTSAAQAGTERPVAAPLVEARGANGAGPLAGGTAPAPLAVRLATRRDPIRVPFRRPPRAGLLFDVDTGEVLWRRNPQRRLPVASLTKMMTALVVADRIAPGEKVRITREALDYRGSAVGLLPLGRSVGVNALLYGLMLPSGNDAARALARHAGGSLPGFIALMNRRARAMGLRCTAFASVDGYRNRGNASCAADLAAIGRAVLRTPRLARVVRRRSVTLPFPIAGGRLSMSNHNPLLTQGYRGTTGLKTGYTRAAGRCLVATANRGGVRLGVVLLHSPDPATQARQLLDRGYARARRLAGRG